VSVGVGLAVSGVATFAFFAVSSRALDPADYSALGVLWGLMFAVGNGLMQPLEQEVARAVSARRAKGVGPGPVIRRAAAIGGAFTLAVVVIVGLAHDLLLDRALNDDAWLIVSFLVGLVGFAVGHLTRGVLSSHRRFHAYALFFGTDGISRVALAAVLGAVGVAAAGAYGMVLAVTPFLGVLVALGRQRGLAEPGPEAPWAEITRALGWLLLGTVSLSLLIQGGTIAVGILSDESEEAAAGVFLNGLQTARIPLFLFQAVLASLLPKLSRLANQREFDGFVSALRRLVIAILGLGVLTTIAAALVGPWFVETVFGSEAALGSRDLAFLAAAFVLVMATICVDQALVAVSAHTRMALGWGLALVVFVAVIAVGDDLFLRVELGLLAGSAIAFVWMLVNLTERLRHHAVAHRVDVSEAVAEIPVDQ
jgi:O-antigen/teichoic acid export membrane protein